MGTSTPSSPAFGQADLSNCEREQIHLAGSIQPHGALLVVDEVSLTVAQASANAAAFLSFGGDVLGRGLAELSADLVTSLRPLLGEPLDGIPASLRFHAAGLPFDGLVHRARPGVVVLELEHAGRAPDLTGALEDGIRAIAASASVRAVCDEAARLFRALTGYDRVMVYRFDADGHGEVFSEERRSALEAFLGNRYPATDIPQIARRLYERNRVRLLVDVGYEPVPIEPRVSASGVELDMSLCFLRSSSPIHIQYLKNMGVSATLVVSLLVGGRLWGLVSCHHYEPRSLVFPMRAVAELLGEAVGTRIAALESFSQAQAEIAVRRLEQRMLESISRDGDWRSALLEPPGVLLQPIGASGAALLLDEQILTAGDVPGTQSLRAIGAWLDEKRLVAGGPGALFSTCSLGLDEPSFASLIPVASGLVAAAVSNTPGEYLLWFRPEQVRTVTWGGDPKKPVIIGDSPSDLSPRRSFAKWHEQVEATSAPWTAATLTTAQRIAASVKDVIVQFRSVGMLIAQHQLEVVRKQVATSEQAVVVATADGRVILANEGFEALLPPEHPGVETLDKLAELFTRPVAARRRIGELVGEHRTWRGEADLVAAQGEIRPVLVRADPVFSAPGRVLGFVVIVTDLTAHKAADAARRRFQDGVVGRSRTHVASKADLLAEGLFSSILHNAQLAALEITDGVEPGAMPELLDSVDRSLARSSELLRHIARRPAPSDEES